MENKDKYVSGCDPFEELKEYYDKELNKVMGIPKELLDENYFHPCITIIEIPSTKKDRSFLQKLRTKLNKKYGR